MHTVCCIALLRFRAWGTEVLRNMNPGARHGCPKILRPQSLLLTFSMYGCVYFLWKRRIISLREYVQRSRTAFHFAIASRL